MASLVEPIRALDYDEEVNGWAALRARRLIGTLNRSRRALIYFMEYLRTPLSTF
jgi:hypothetical protein